MDIGRQLRALRRARRRTLEELAAETGFTRSYLSQIETSEAPSSQPSSHSGPARQSTSRAPATR